MSKLNALRVGPLFSARCFHFSSLSCFLGLSLAFVPSEATARDKRVVIRSHPSGAKVVLVGGGMICKPLDKEGTAGVTPCSFSIDEGAFDPDGRYWMRSKLLGVPLKVELSKEGYRPTELYLTEKEPRKWRGTDVAGPIERTYYFVTQERFEAQLQADPNYAQAATELLRNRPSSRLMDVTARDALADCRRFYDNNEPERALQACNVALGLAGANPDPDVYHYRCMANFVLRNYQTALGDCQELTRLRPSGDTGWNNAGLILQTMGRHLEAIASFSKALDLNGKNLKALRNRATSYERQNKIDEALNDCKIALQIAPGDKEILLMQSRLQSRAGVAK